MVQRFDLALRTFRHVNYEAVFSFVFDHGKSYLTKVGSSALKEGNIMKNAIFVAASVLALAVPFSAHAVTVLNSDAEVRTLTVTEKGVRSEVSIEANAKVNACPNGCFISFPSGDMLAVKGKEDIVIEGGKGRIVNN